MPELRSPLAGERRPRRRQHDVALARRIGSWLVWWVLLMTFWILLDDSLALAELLAGAGAAVLGASLAEVVQYQSATHFRMRIEWVTPALRLPIDVARDLIVVFRALWDRLAHGRQPPSGFREVPASWGDEKPEAVTRRALPVAGRSMAPNTIVLGIDKERGVMVVHQLVVNQGEPTTDLATGAGSAVGAAVLALVSLYWRRIPVLRKGWKPGTGLVEPIRRLQSGVVADYVTWLVVGVACLGGALAFSIH